MCLVKMTYVINWQFITSILRQYNVKIGDRARTIEGVIVKHLYQLFLFPVVGVKSHLIIEFYGRVGGGEPL